MMSFIASKIARYGSGIKLSFNFIPEPDWHIPLLLYY